jgi:hypothetical protein
VGNNFRAGPLAPPPSPPLFGELNLDIRVRAGFETEGQMEQIKLLVWEAHQLLQAKIHLVTGDASVTWTLPGYDPPTETDT